MRALVASSCSANTTAGAPVSSPSTEFGAPGVPPASASDDAQLTNTLLGPAGSMRSSAAVSDSPQPGSYCTESTIASVAAYRSTTASPLLLRFGKPATSSTGPASGNVCANTAALATSTTYWSGSRKNGATASGAGALLASLRVNSLRSKLASERL